MNSERKKYHHGNLQVELTNAATEMLNSGGIGALSLRKIAERVGVSRTAAYHHFKDKNDLLCAIAANGFELWQQKAKQIFNQHYENQAQQIKAFVFAYLEFATQHEHLYDLMFGGTIWKNQQEHKILKDSAYPTFDYQVKMVKHWQECGILAQHSTLRMSQVLWGTLHGIAKLTIDGIYTEQSSIEQMCQCAVDIFVSSEQSNL